MDDEPTLVKDPYLEIVVDPWPSGEESTAVFEVSAGALPSEQKLVVGYLTMEQNGLFAGLSEEEQLAAVANLTR